MDLIQFAANSLNLLIFTYNVTLGKVLPSCFCCKFQLFSEIIKPRVKQISIFDNCKTKHKIYR